MLRHTVLIAAAAAALVGCETSARLGPVGGGDRTSPTQQTQLAAFAAKPENQYPSDAQATDDLRAAAIVDGEAGNIKIYNFTDEPLTNVKVWVNGTHLYQVDNIPAKQSKTLPRSLFYNKNGMSLANSDTPVQRVQIQTSDDTLATLLGPVFETGN